jgi:hypothetical protein
MDKERFKIVIQQIVNPYRNVWFAPQFHNVSRKNYDNLIKEDYISKPSQKEEWILVGEK